ncbi:MAG: hypothetical protein COV52_09505 [Gammaproteobacteria bacterium CG11_big_fil_rev_8_21_14_0_20_46_22]|nr:MAG: hypothetical protein COW05_03615 [Gammaproteobacteria bacterium CG12_big_fil_rev_8_21_14_0_65_46_12]PIR10283.1 MAG: hypothetical protein COV52_09505 [Gammaproteobacteria bacterium CG11_big_fil_rev_8_21_14_0_20_46_22]
MLVNNPLLPQEGMSASGRFLSRLLELASVYPPLKIFAELETEKISFLLIQTKNSAPVFQQQYFIELVSRMACYVVMIFDQENSLDGKKLLSHLSTTNITTQASFDEILGLAFELLKRLRQLHGLKKPASYTNVLSTEETIAAFVVFYEKHRLDQTARRRLGIPSPPIGNANLSLAAMRHYYKLCAQYLTRQEIERLIALDSITATHRAACIEKSLLQFEQNERLQLARLSRQIIVLTRWLHKLTEAASHGLDPCELYELYQAKFAILEAMLRQLDWQTVAQELFSSAGDLAEKIRQLNEIRAKVAQAEQQLFSRFSWRTRFCGRLAAFFTAHPVHVLTATCFDRVYPAQTHTKTGDGLTSQQRQTVKRVAGTISTILHLYLFSSFARIFASPALIGLEYISQYFLLQWPLLLLLNTALNGVLKTINRILPRQHQFDAHQDEENFLAHQSLLKQMVMFGLLTLANGFSLPLLLAFLGTEILNHCTTKLINKLVSPSSMTNFFAQYAVHAANYTLCFSVIYNMIQTLFTQYAQGKTQSEKIQAAQKLLGISGQETPSDCAGTTTQAFRQKARFFHPDKCETPDCTETFLRLVEARDTLLKRCAGALENESTFAQNKH